MICLPCIKPWKGFWGKEKHDVKKEKLLFCLSGLVWNLFLGRMLIGRISCYAKLCCVCNSSRNTWNKPNSSVQHWGIAGGRSWLLNSLGNIWRGNWKSSGLRRKQERDGERLWISCQLFPGKHRALQAGFVQQREAGAGFKHRKSQRAAAKEGLNPRQTRGRKMHLQAKFPEDGSIVTLASQRPFIFSFFLRKMFGKKICTDYLKFKMFRQRTVSILRPPCSSQGWQIAGEAFEDFTQLRFPSSSSASVPMIQRGMEISPVFFGFQLSCEKVSFSSFYPSQIALEL